MTSALLPLTRLTAAVAPLCLVHLLAFGQSHVEDSGQHVLRASTVAAGNLPAAMREQHGIPLDRNTGVLNVTVQRRTGTRLENVPARVEVQARNLMGAPTSVQMREVVANGLVSYLGVYRFLPGEVLDFRITAHPAASSPAVVLEFRDRLSAAGAAAPPS